jgi:hypothetical protein
MGRRVLRYYTGRRYDGRCSETFTTNACHRDAANLSTHHFYSVARDSECVYAPLPRGRSTGRSREANNELGARLRRLEQLVNNVVSQSPSSQQPDGTLGVPQHSVRGGSVSDDAAANSSPDQFESICSSGSEKSQIQPGRVILGGKETIYVSGDHWASMCNEVRFPKLTYTRRANHSVG